MTGQLRTIVLDTSPTTRKILEVILHREGHQVACFDDSLEALRALSRHGPADLLFLGLDLPKMDGFEVLKYLRGEPRFHSMGTIALLGERDGIDGGGVRGQSRSSSLIEVLARVFSSTRLTMTAQ